MHYVWKYLIKTYILISEVGEVRLHAVLLQDRRGLCDNNHQLDKATDKMKPFAEVTTWGKNLKDLDANK